MNLGGWEGLGWALLATGLLILLLAVWVGVRRSRRLQVQSQLGGTMGHAEVRAPAAGLLDGDESASPNGATDPWSESIIYGLAQQLATAVDKLDENTRAKAGREAELGGGKNSSRRGGGSALARVGAGPGRGQGRVERHGS